jgi:hypothetical protein
VRKASFVRLLHANRRYRAGALAVPHGADLYTIRKRIPAALYLPADPAILTVPLVLVPFDVGKVVWIAMVYGPLAVAIRFGFRPLLATAGAGTPRRCSAPNSAAAR